MNYARFLQIDAENALERTNRKFIHRFTRMEEEARAQGRSLADMTLQEMDGLWDMIKSGTLNQNGLKSFFIDIFRRNIYILLTAFGLFLTGYFLNLYFSGDASIRRLRNSIQSFLQERERDFDALSKDTALMTRLAEKQYTKKDLDLLVDKKYGFFLYGSDSVGAGLYLQFWNDQRSLPTMALINGPDTAGFIRLANGQYGYIKQTTFDSDRKPHLAIALIPVHWQYYITLSNLSPEFVDFPLAEKRVEIVLTPTDLPVVDYRGSTLFYLTRKAGYHAPAHIWPIPMMILLGVLLVLIIIHNIAHTVRERWGTSWGIAFLVTTIGLMRVIVYLAPGLLNLRQFELFDPTIYSSSIILNSLGDLVINSFLFCWIIMFVRRELADYTIPQSIHRWKNWLLMSIGLALLVMTTFLFANIVQSLVTDAKISFNVTNFFSLLENYSFVGFIALAALALGYFFLSQILFQLIGYLIRSLSIVLYIITATMGLLALTFIQRCGDG